MSLLSVRATPPDPAAIALASEQLRAGGIVAIPTETVYGLAANALDPAAVARIYEAKGRPANNPLIVHLPDAAAARRLVRAWPAAAERLAARYWPGPLTLVLPRSPAVPDIVTAGLDTVALRVPAHPVALAVLRAAGIPLAAPSANRSGEVSPTTAAHVVRSLGDRVPLVLDAGPSAVGIESTVVDLSGPEPAILRPGMISRLELEAILGPLTDRTQEAEAGKTAPLRSPGMLPRHYAPRARVVLYDDPAEAALTAAVREARAAGAGARIAAVIHHAAPEGVDDVVRLPRNAAAYARQLYGALHQLDDAGTTLLLIERPPTDPAWEGVRDRLRRAATPE